LGDRFDRNQDKNEGENDDDEHKDGEGAEH
jgi:hypothetical protein